MKTITKKQRKRGIIAAFAACLCALVGGGAILNATTPDLATADTFTPVNYDFSDSSQASAFKSQANSLGSVSDGVFNFTAWGANYLNVPFSTSGDVYISFDFYVPSATTLGTSYSQMWASLTTDLSAPNSGTKSVGFWMNNNNDGKTYVEYGAYQAQSYIGQFSNMYYDAVYNMEMIIQNQTITYYINGSKLTLVEKSDIPVPTNTANTEDPYQTYLIFQFSHAGGYIDNLIIEDNFDRRYGIIETDKSFVGYDKLKLSEVNDSSACPGWNTEVTDLSAVKQLVRSSYYSVSYNWTGAEYYSFTVNNATDSYAGFVVDVANGKNTGNYGLWYTAAEGYPYYLESEDGSISVGETKTSARKASNGTVLNSGSVIVPKGFNGRVYIPISAFEVLDWSATKNSVTNHTDDANVLNLARIGWTDIYYYPENKAATGSITIGGEAAYGKNITHGTVTTDAVVKTVKAIADIGGVTAASEAQIAFARELYDNLSEEDKALVTNAATLTTAEETFYALENKSYVIGTDGKDFTGTAGVSFAKPFSSAPATLSAWIRVDRATPYLTHVGTVIGTAERYSSVIFDRTATFSFEITTNGNPKFEWRQSRTNKAVFIVDNVDVRTGKWVYVAFTRDVENGVLTCYVNGVAVASMSTDTDNLKNFTMLKPAIVGSDYTNDDVLGYGFTPDFHGSIADVRAYSAVLTASEVASDYEGAALENLLGGINFASGESDYYFDYADDDAQDAYGWLTVEDSYFEAKDGEYTFAVIPDTQMLFSGAPKDSNGNSVYSDDYDVTDTNVFYNNLEWLVKNKSLLNLQYLLHVGDLTDCLNYSNYAKEGRYETQWGFQSLQYLTDNGINWALARGNHDGGYEAKKLVIWDEYWYASEAYKKATTANEDENAPAKTFTAEVADGVSGTYSYYETFTAGTTDYIVVVLDLEPSDTVLAWANEVLTYYSDRTAIVLTHAYLNANGTSFITSLMGVAAYHNNGQSIWDECISKHANVAMVISGHSSGPDIGRKVLTGVHGNKVWNFMIDFSSYEFAGNTQPGLFSLLKFSADGSQVTFHMYSSAKSAIFRNWNTFTVNLGEIEEVEEDDTTEDTTVWPDETDTRQIVLKPNIQPFPKVASGQLQTTENETGSDASLQFAATSGIQFRSGWQAYGLSIDISEDGIFKFTSDAGISAVWCLRVTLLQTSAKDGLTRVVPLTDPDDTDTLVYVNGIYGGTTSSSAEYSVSFAALLPDGVSVANGDQLTLVFAGTNSDWVYGCFNGAVYDTKGTLVKDYTLGIKNGTTNTAAINGLFEAGYNGKLLDGTASSQKNYKGFTAGWLHLTGSFANFFTNYTNTVTVKDESGNTLFTAISGSMGSGVGVQNKLPTLYKEGYKFLGYNVNGNIYAGDTYSVYGTSSSSGTTQTVIALFEELPIVPIYDTDGFAALTLPKGFNGELPTLTRTGRIFLGYLIDGEACPAGTVYDSASGKEIQAVFASFSMVNGAAVRTSSPSGVRFQTYLNEAAYNWLILAGYEVSFGTLIVPADLASENGVVNYNLLTLDTTLTTLNVVSSKQFTVGGWMYYNAAVVNVKEGNYNRNFIARGYMQIEKEGETTTYYASVNDNGRTIVEIAEKALADISTVKSKTYCYAVDGGYSRYDDTQRQTLEAIVAKAE